MVADVSYQVEANVVLRCVGLEHDHQGHVSIVFHEGLLQYRSGHIYIYIERYGTVNTNKTMIDDLIYIYICYETKYTNYISI